MSSLCERAYGTSKIEFAVFKAKGVESVSFDERRHRPKIMLNGRLPERSKTWYLLLIIVWIFKSFMATRVQTCSEGVEIEGGPGFSSGLTCSRYVLSTVSMGREAHKL